MEVYAIVYKKGRKGDRLTCLSADGCETDRNSLLTRK